MRSKQQQLGLLELTRRRVFFSVSGNLRMQSSFLKASCRSKKESRELLPSGSLVSLRLLLGASSLATKLILLRSAFAFLLQVDWLHCRSQSLPSPPFLLLFLRSSFPTLSDQNIRRIHLRRPSQLAHSRFRVHLSHDFSPLSNPRHQQQLYRIYRLRERHLQSSSMPSWLQDPGSCRIE